MQTLIRYAVRGRFVLSILGIAILAIAYPASTRLKTDQSVQSLFGKNDPTIRQYQDLKTWFGNDEILVLMYRDSSLASSEGMQRSEKITTQIKSLDGVTAVLSPWVLDQAAEGMSTASLPFGLGNKIEDPLPKLMRKDDPIGSGLNQIFSGYTHSIDFQHAAVVAMIDQEHSPETVEKIRTIADHWEGSPGVSEVSLIGEPVLVDQAFALVNRDGNRLAITTVILLSLVVIVSLLDVRLVLLLSLIIGWTVIVTKATMYWIGIELSLIASILTAIVTVIAVTAVLHLGVRYHGRRRRGFNRSEATQDVMTTMAAPIFWTCATDAAGFAALWFSEIQPVRQFGMMVALAALSVFAAILLFSPTCFMIAELNLGQSKLSYQVRITRSMRRLCFRVSSWFVENRWWTAIGTVVLIAVSVWIVTGAETETSFLSNFRDDSSIVVEYGRVEDNLGGAGVWDLVLEVNDPVTNDQLEIVRTLERQLIDELGPIGLSKAISIADATEVIGRSNAGKWLPAALRIEAMRTRLPSFIAALVSDPLPSKAQRRKLRIMLRSPEGLPAAQKRTLMNRTTEIAQQYIDRGELVHVANEPAPTAMVTGYYVIMTKLVDQLVQDQWRCFAAATALIWLLMCFATRSIRQATAALVPNLLPAFLVLSAVSISGGTINMGAAMIAAVSVGLSIDGSVHLLMVYRRRRKIGRKSEAAAVSAAGNIGAPVLLATIALVAGFSVLSTSEFIPTATFGTLVAWTLIIGTWINLSLLPALVSIGRD
ncbi:MMPL family transporter [Stieleria sp. JC731]|uniref:efflux RND transporter permease subunit n=1 Tax=Pirellulaceae TaxID=2691357 RepID=UPI001E2D26E4|nr:MMPL family transporter [Stieleria sp. JC731]MCC9600161.1 MMPL family transporter [Stieleria sp. JC731]